MSTVAVQNTDNTLISDHSENIEKPKITLSVDSLNVVATWKYDVENDMCALCHQDLMIPTQRSIRDKVINGNVTIGKCKHGFHEDCIERWIKNGNISCTVCNTTWNASKSVGSAVYVYKDTVIEPNNIIDILK